MTCDVHITGKVVATDSVVTTLSVAIAVTLMCTSLSQHCHYHCCPIAVTVSAVPSLYQYHDCRNAVFAARALCSFSLSQCCAHWCLIAVGVLCAAPNMCAVILLIYASPYKILTFTFYYIHPIKQEFRG